MVERNLLSHTAKAEVTLALKTSAGHIRLRVEGVEVELRVAVHDGDTSECNTNDTSDIAGEVTVALRSRVSLRPLEIANLRIQGRLAGNDDWSRVEISGVEVALDIDQVLLRGCCRLVAVRGERVGLHANVGQVLPNLACRAQLSLEGADVLVGERCNRSASPRCWRRRSIANRSRRSAISRWVVEGSRTAIPSVARVARRSWW